MNASARRGRFMRMPDVVTSTGLSSATINRMHRRGEFPPKVRISLGATGWWESEIEAWKAERGAAAPRPPESNPRAAKNNRGGVRGGTQEPAHA